MDYVDSALKDHRVQDEPNVKVSVEQTFYICASSDHHFMGNNVNGMEKITPVKHFKGLSYVKLQKTEQ